VKFFRNHVGQRRLYQVIATIHMQDLSGHETVRHQEEDGLGDILRPAGIAVGRVEAVCASICRLAWLYRTTGLLREPAELVAYLFIRFAGFAADERLPAKSRKIHEFKSGPPSSDLLSLSKGGPPSP